MKQTAQPDDAIGRSAMAKAMWRIVPLILLTYVVAYIDRVNVSFASLQMNGSPARRSDAVKRPRLSGRQSHVKTVMRADGLSSLPV